MPFATRSACLSPEARPWKTGICEVCQTCLCYRLNGHMSTRHAVWSNGHADFIFYETREPGLKPAHRHDHYPARIISPPCSQSAGMTVRAANRCLMWSLHGFLVRRNSQMGGGIEINDVRPFSNCFRHSAKKRFFVMTITSFARGPR